MGKYTVQYLNSINPSEFLVKHLPDGSNKYTLATFTDSIYGDWTTAIRNVVRKKGSTHPNRKSDSIKQGLFKSEAFKAVGQKTKQSRIKNGSYKKTKKSILKQKNTWQYKRQKKFTVDNINNMLPDDVKIISEVDYKSFNVEKSYTFKDPVYGEFQSTVRCLIEAGHSTHPAKSTQRRHKTLASIKKGYSKPEQEIKNFLQSIGVETFKSNIGNTAKEIDLYSKDYNIGIEYNENYFHYEGRSKITKHYHAEKTELAKHFNIQLLQFFTQEWKHRNFQVKSFLKSKFGKNTIKVAARKCLVKIVDKEEAKTFLNKYHILGACSFSICYGIYSNSELISLITLGPHHRLGSKELILNRYVSKENVTVIGGLSKLCTHAKKIHGSFYTFVDLRWSSGENWYKCGWTFEKKVSVDYFFLDIKNQMVYSKQSKKHLTNLQCELLGLKKVWDCGKIKLKY